MPDGICRGVRAFHLYVLNDCAECRQPFVRRDRRGRVHEYLLGFYVFRRRFLGMGLDNPQDMGYSMS